MSLVGKESIEVLLGVLYIDQVGFLLQMLLASAITIPALAIIYFKHIRLIILKLLKRLVRKCWR